MAGTLAGIKVVDLSRVLGGPYCSQILADHGAEIIKVEPPQGDETRNWGPPFKDGLSAYFAGVNRNKRSIAIDIRTEAGRETVLTLLEKADVLIHNFKCGAIEAWGLGYEDVLRDRFPRLVFCHVNGFGADGPLGSLPGYDAVIQAMSGLMSVNGAPDGGPMRMGIPIVDIATGLIACNAILAGLVERSHSGRGQAVEVPLYDSALSILHPHATNALMTGKTPVSTGNAHPSIVPYDMFQTRTVPIFLAVGNDGQFAKLCRALDIGDLATDPRFTDNKSRVANRAALTETLSEKLAERDAADLESTLLAAGVPAGAVRTVTEALAFDHTAHRSMVLEQGSYRTTGIPARFDRTPGRLTSPPPRFAQHSREILQEAGFGEEEIGKLVATGAVITA